MHRQTRVPSYRVEGFARSPSYFTAAPRGFLSIQKRSRLAKPTEVGQSWRALSEISYRVPQVRLSPTCFHCPPSYLRARRQLWPLHALCDPRPGNADGYSFVFISRLLPTCRDPLPNRRSYDSFSDLYLPPTLGREQMYALSFFNVAVTKCNALLNFNTRLLTSEWNRLEFQWARCPRKFVTLFFI